MFHLLWHLLGTRYAPSAVLALLCLVLLLVSHRWDSPRSRRQLRRERRAWVREVRSAEVRRAVMATYVVGRDIS